MPANVFGEFAPEQGCSLCHPMGVRLSSSLRYASGQRLRRVVS
jgi:hypothetical protein